MHTPLANLEFVWPHNGETDDLRNPREADIARLKQMAASKPARKSLDTIWVAVKASSEQVKFLRTVIADFHDRILSHESHCEIESILAQTEHTRNAVTTWILVPQSDQSGTDIRCSLILSEFTAYLAVPGQDEVQTVRALYAGAAATPMHHRKMGYASSLLKQVQEFYRPKRDEFFFCQWFSHAGQLFSKLNGKTTPCWNFWVDEKFQEAQDSDMSQIRYLVREDHARIVSADDIALKREVMAVCQETQKISVVMRPDADCLNHKFEMAYQTMKLAKPNPAYSDRNNSSLAICGAEIPCGEEEAPSFALWRLTSYNKPINELYLLIIRLRYKTRDELKILFTAAVRTSREWGCGGRVNIRTNENNFEDLLHLKLQNEAFDENKGASMSAILRGDSLLSTEELRNHKTLLVERYLTG